MSEQSVANYVVVKFVDPEGITTVDAVPKSWIYVAKADKKIKCYYPPKDQWTKVPSWSRQLIGPDKSWEPSDVLCRYNTGKHDND